MRIAVIGGGISGLSASWLLSQEHTVTLFEAADYLGGHTHTVDVTLDGHSHGVDTGFLVFNHRTYPNLTALFAHFEVPVAKSEMSFAVSLSAPAIEWSGTSLATLFAQRSNLARPGFWRMLQDIVRFNRESVSEAALFADEPSLGDYLERRRYSVEFRDWYLLPMAAAIWSCPAQQMLAYPLRTFVRFCGNHGLLQLFDRPQWMTVQGGGRNYVERIARQLPDVRIGHPVTRVVRQGQRVFVESGATELFDQVVFACHSDQTLRLLGADAHDEEKRLLGAVRYQPNRAVLHTDCALLPRRRSTWSAWNYMAASPDSQQMGRAPAVSVSYLINKLQPVPFERPVIVSLNPFVEPAEDKIIAEFDYAHPVFDATAIDAQARIGQLQGARRTWFCGAWLGHGFHEDGLRSALDIAKRFGVRAPWQVPVATSAVAEAEFA